MTLSTSDYFFHLDLHVWAVRFFIIIRSAILFPLSLINMCGGFDFLKENGGLFSSESAKSARRAGVKYFASELFSFKGSLSYHLIAVSC